MNNLMCLFFNVRFNWGVNMQRKSEEILKLLGGKEVLKEARLRAFKVTREIQGFGSSNTYFAVIAISISIPIHVSSSSLAYESSRNSSLSSFSTSDMNNEIEKIVCFNFRTTMKMLKDCTFGIVLHPKRQALFLKVTKMNIMRKKEMVLLVEFSQSLGVSLLQELVVLGLRLALGVSLILGGW